MQSKECHTTSLPTIINIGNNSRHIHQLPHITNNCRKNFRQRHHLHIHKNRSYSTQRNRCTHQMQRGATTHRSTGRAWTIPHSTDSKKMTMATKNPIQKGSTRTRKGKQCVQSTVHRKMNEMDARSVQVPSQINVAQGHCSRKLHRVATPQRAECKKVLPRNY